MTEINTAAPIKSATVYCSMASNLPPDYYVQGAAVGKALAEAGIHMLYGGANYGLMGTVADACLAAGGTVTGVVPNVPVLEQYTHRGLSELIVSETMAVRKYEMHKADTFIALPGGYGTLDEVFEVLTLRKLQMHNKQVYFYNNDGFWNPMMQMLAHFISMRTMNPDHLNYFTFVNSVPELMSFLRPR